MYYIKYYVHVLKLILELLPQVSRISSCEEIITIQLNI